MDAIDVILEDYPLPKGVDVMKLEERIKKANERIKELQLLIHHWEKNDRLTKMAKMAKTTET